MVVRNIPEYGHPRYNEQYNCKIEQLAFMEAVPKAGKFAFSEENKIISDDDTLEQAPDGQLSLF